MTTRPTPPKVTAAERDVAVLAVLNAADKPIGPSEIGRRVGQPWSCYDSTYGMSAPITPVLRRIGAVRHKGGLYTKPETQA